MISRRNFLKIAGVGAASLSLPLGLTTHAAEAPAKGRILREVWGHAYPNAISTTTVRYLPDSVHPLLDYQAGWVKLPQGYIPETALQPMMPAETTPPEITSVWAEVTAPYAAVRAYAAGNAPVIERLGHGAVFEVAHILADAAGQSWLRIDLPTQSGWIHAQETQIAPVSAATTPHHATLQHGTLTIWKNEHPLLSLVATTTPHPGTFTITHRYPYQHLEAHPAAPWVLETDQGALIHGVYWHNDFGRSTSNVELSAIGAKMLFSYMTEGSQLIIL